VLTRPGAVPSDLSSAVSSSGPSPLASSPPANGLAPALPLLVPGPSPPPRSSSVPAAAVYVGGRAGSGGRGSLGVSSTIRATAARSRIRGSSLPAHQRSAWRLPWKMQAARSFLVSHIFQVPRCTRTPGSLAGETWAICRLFLHGVQISPRWIQPEEGGAERTPWQPCKGARPKAHGRRSQILQTRQ
jgi:hypothetical protein